MAPETKRNRRGRVSESLAQCEHPVLKDEVEFHYAAVPTKCDVCGNIYQSMMMYEVEDRKICYVCIKEVDVTKGSRET